MDKVLGIVVVDFRSTAATARFIREDISRISLPYAVAIVMNGCSDTRPMEEALNDFDGGPVTVLANSGNEGFAKACNKGAEALRDKYGPEFLLFTNNDVHMAEDDAVERLVAKLRTLPDAGIIGPEIVGPDGKRQSPEPYRSFSNKHLLPYWGKLTMKRERLRRATFEDYAQNAKEGWCYRVMGSFFVARAEDFFGAGEMDPATFLYGEEAILSERMARIGRKVYFYPSVRVVHEHGATTKKHFSRIRIRRMKLRSDIYYYRTYRKVKAAEIAAARLTYFLKDITFR